MTIRELDTVVLNHDLPEHGLRSGDLGAVVHMDGDDHLVVEFVLHSGETQALVSLSAADVRPLDPNDLPAVRRP